MASVADSDYTKLPMKRKILAVVAMLAAFGSFLGASSALAQTYTPAPQGHYFFGHASTAQEGYLRGRADVIWAWGEANYWNSLAAIHFEQARSAYMDNKLKAVNTYFQMRETNKAYVRAEVK